MTKPKVLLVAVGGYGSKYLVEMTEKDTGGELVGIVEVMPDIRQKFPVIDERSIPLYTSLEDFYAHHTADLAVISSPIHLHTEMVLTCLRHGSNVLCEKPLCLTEEEADRMAACAEETGHFLAIGYQLNYDRRVLAMKRDILSGKLGAPVRMRVVHAMRRGMKYYARNNWAGHIIADGREVMDSPFNNACAHNFQMMTFLLGPDMASSCAIERVDAELWRGNATVENFDIAALRFVTSGGTPILYYTAHPLASKNLGPIGRLEFENGVITYTKDDIYRAELKDGTVIDYGDLPETPLLQKLYDCIACCQGGPLPTCTVAAEHSHIQAVRMVQQHPIRDVDPGHITMLEENGDTFPLVRHLEEVFLRSAEAWALPGELGLTL